MAAVTLETGKTYQVKLTAGRWVPARLESITETGGGGYARPPWMVAPQHIRRSMKRYHFTNLASGRSIVIKSMAKVRDAAPAT